MTSPSTPEFAISKLAEELDISTRTIRFYEEKGLIRPARTKGNQRIYSKRDRTRLKLILRGRRFGYSLDEISEMIGLSDVDMDEVAQIQKSLDYGARKLADISQRIEELQLLERDMLDMKERLVQRLEALEGRTAKPS
ncbi:MAG: MerR family DNA-binding transcriptional regulator [Pseudomonadota bacterium]